MINIRHQHYRSLLTQMRDGTAFVRSVASAVAFAVLWLSVFPTLLVAQESNRRESALQAINEPSSESTLNGALTLLQGALDDVAKRSDDEMAVAKFVELVEDIVGIDGPSAILPTVKGQAFNEY